jgi:hypothetical protein
MQERREKRLTASMLQKWCCASCAPEARPEKTRPQVCACGHRNSRKSVRLLQVLIRDEAADKARSGPAREACRDVKREPQQHLQRTACAVDHACAML